MRYILADMVKAKEHGINLAGRRIKGAKVALNEKEVMCSPGLSGASTFEDKLQLLDGQSYSAAQIIDILNRTDNE